MHPEDQEVNRLEVDREAARAFIRNNSTVNTTNGCWIWNLARIKAPRAINSGGYGQVNKSRWVKRKLHRAHRLSWFAFKGPIPEGLFVLHKCDNPPCCNPDHLFLGTAKINSDDAYSKGRGFSGERHPYSKLTAEQVKEIRRLFAAGVGCPELSAKFNYQRGSIYRIVHRQVWRSVP